MGIEKAVKKASNVSKREGKWANKSEISKKIVGRKPDSLSEALAKEVKDGDIEKKSRAELWRPKNAGGGGGIGGSKERGTRGGETSTRGGRRSSGGRRTSTRAQGRRSGRRTSNGSTGRGIRDMVGIAATGVVAVGALEAMNVGGITRT